MFHVKPLLFLFVIFPLISFSQHVGSTLLEVKDLPPLPVKDARIVEFIKPYSSSLSSTQEEWFYWTNYSRSNPRRFWDSVISPILEVYPKFRNNYISSLKEDLMKSSPLPFVKPNNNLAKVAQELATSLASTRSAPSHTSASGVTFETRMESIKIKRCAGENISFGPPNTLMMLVLLYIDEGVPGLGHRKTLLNPSFVEMGVGVGSYPDGKSMVVTDFACDQK